MSDGADCWHLLRWSPATRWPRSQQSVSLSFHRFRCLQWKTKPWCQLSSVLFALLCLCCLSPAASRCLDLLWEPPVRCTTWATSRTRTTASSPRWSRRCQSTEGRGGTQVWGRRWSPSTSTWNTLRRSSRCPPERRGSWTGIKSTTLSDWSSRKMNALHRGIKVSQLYSNPRTQQLIWTLTAHTAVPVQGPHQWAQTSKNT